MSASQYEVLKCEDCRKTLGYIYETVTMYPPAHVLKLITGVYQKINRTVFCEECFLRRRAEVAKHE